MALLKDVLGPLYGPLHGLAWEAFPFFSLDNRNTVFVVSTILLATWLYFRRRSGNPASLRAWWRFIAPRDVFLHPSAIADYKVYFVNALLLSPFMLGAFIGVLVALLSVSHWTTKLMAAAHVRPDGDVPGLLAQVAFTFIMVVTIDASKWLAHYLQHRVALLWEFHKVHHSAVVLTPVSNYRVHPVDFLVEQSIVAVLGGIASGIFAAHYSGGMTGLTIMNISAILFVYHLQSNLRHSHIPLHFPRWVSVVLSSPAMHQVHHSAEERHVDKNFALIFSVWDQLAGTNYIPSRNEQFRLGLTGNEDREFGSLRAIYLRPFKQVFSTFRTKRALDPARVK